MNRPTYRVRQNRSTEAALRTPKRTNPDAKKCRRKWAGRLRQVTRPRGSQPQFDGGAYLNKLFNEGLDRVFTGQPSKILIPITFCQRTLAACTGLSKSTGWKTLNLPHTVKWCLLFALDNPESYQRWVTALTNYCSAEGIADQSNFVAGRLGLRFKRQLKGLNILDLDRA